jgi:hypothetical protein
MKATILSVAAVVIASLLAACSEKKSDTQKREEMLQNETPEERSWRWKSEAPAAVATVCSNEVVGFRRMMGNVYVLTHDNPNVPGKWTANAEVEFINTVGGAEVTNLPMTFSAVNGEICAGVDFRAIFEAQRKALVAKYEGESRESRTPDIAP